MANKKFSDFTQKTSTADVDFVVGYDGSDNVRISPSNLTADSLPLAGGTMTGDIAFSSTSNGVKLGGSGSANLLTDYERGTFSPTYDIVGGTITATYSENRGAYVKVGRMVTVWIEIKTNSLSKTGSGTAVIAGLPFTVGGVDCCPIYTFPATGTITNLNGNNLNNFSSISNGTDISVTAIPNTTYVQFKYTNFGNTYNASQSMTDAQYFATHSSPTPARNGLALTLTYYTIQ